MRKRSTFSGADPRARFVEMLLANGLLALVVTLCYIALSALLSPFFSRRDAPWAYLLATITIALAIVPVRRRVRLVLHRLLHSDWQTGQELMREVGQLLSRTINPEVLHSLLIDELPRRLLIQHASIWMLEPPDDLVFKALGGKSNFPGARMLANGASVGQIREAVSYLLFAPQEDADWAAPFVGRGIHLIIPMRVGEQLIGFYGCGLPRQARVYPPRVLEILLTLAPAIATALENARAYATIEQLNEQLRELDQLKDEFIENVGHELRTPLTSLSLTVQILTAQREIPTVLSDVMRESVARLEALVDRVLTFDQHALVEQSVTDSIEIGPLLQEIVEEYGLAAQIKGLQFVVSVSAGLVVQGNTVRLRRALQEVVDNAVRYSPAGQVTLVATLQDGLVRISVADQGPGIPSEERDQLFAAFFRGRSTRALAETPGAGLGLSIARRDIETLGGRIWLEHSDTQGSVICVAIPSVRVFGDLSSNDHAQERVVGA